MDCTFQHYLGGISYWSYKCCPWNCLLWQKQLNSYTIVVWVTTLKYLVFNSSHSCVSRWLWRQQGCSLLWSPSLYRLPGPTHQSSTPSAPLPSQTPLPFPPLWNTLQRPFPPLFQDRRRGENTMKTPQWRWNGVRRRKELLSDAKTLKVGGLGSWSLTC